LGREGVGKSDLGAALGGDDHRPQRAGAAIGSVGDRQRAGDGAVFQGFEPEHEPMRAGAPRATTGVRLKRRFAAGCFQPRAEKGSHDSWSLKQAVCGIMATATSPARRLSAGAVPGRWEASLAVRPHRPRLFSSTYLLWAGDSGSSPRAWPQRITLTGSS